MEIKSYNGKSTQIFTIKNARCFEQCKYVFTEKNMSKYITNNIEISLDYFNREDSDKKIKYEMCLFLYLNHFEWF